ncbi:MAG: LysR family transcriptional regulator [Verrucomicrobiae bacterium]|nr:LysR family transcriptional regulator [Verrucomicrobiae bacterium]MCB1085402.1 LysR family transcriptional regulator [Verrucomicrobiae bacterium]MCB1089956.1 LysR family transcriptional regulator [Verrucomicrobiae bacterium]
MDLRHLRYFNAVAEALSFSGASRRLRIAQPALSRAVRELEDELGVELIDRRKRKIRLTPAGETLLRDASVLIEHIEETARRVRRTASGEIGELRLGYIGPPVIGFLGSLIDEYRSLHPGVHIVLEERTPERVWEMVDRGRLSVGITRPVLAYRSLGLPQEILFEEKFCAAIPMNHPWTNRSRIRWAELDGQPAILLSRREGAGSHDRILAACDQAGISLRIAHTPSLMSTILRYVESGAGIGVVPECASSETTCARLIPLSPRVNLPLVLVWGKSGDDPAVLAFRKLVRNWKELGRLNPPS